MTAVPHRATFNTPSPFTPRQHEVLRWVVEGKSASEIAEIMGISWHTVSHHIRDCKMLAGVNKDTALVATAFRRGWIQ